jgi:putative acyltransferase domain protein
MYIRKNNLFIVLLFCLITAISLVVASDKVINKKINIIFSSICNRSYNNLSKEDTFFKVDISFILNKIVYNNDNLFQTADYNDGLRLEFYENNASLLFPDSEGKLFGIPLNTEIALDQEYKLEIIYNSHKIRINLDGKEIVNSFTNIYPEFNNIKFGKGFDDNRKFKSGKILRTDFILRNLTNYDFSFFIIILLIIAIFINIKFILLNMDKNNIINPPKDYIYNKNIYNKLLLLRTIAWAMVFIIHGYIIFYNSKVSENLGKIFLSNIDLTFLKFPSAWGGVWIFFVLSGFLMGKAFVTKRYCYDRDGIFRFYKNRIIQICPVYYFCVFTLAIFVYPEIFWLENIKSLIRVATFTNESLLNINLNGALWSLSTEIQFYVLAPFLVRFIIFLSDKIGLKKVTFFLIIFGVVERYILYKIGYNNSINFGFWDRYIYKPLYCNIDLFLFGILANLYIDRVSKKYKFKYIGFFWGILLALLLFVNFFFGYYTFNDYIESYAKKFIYILPTFTALITFLLIILIEYKDILLGTKNNKNILHYLGIMTFVIYVWHEPILLRVHQIIEQYHFDIGLNLFIGLCFCLFFGLLSYVFIEKPVSLYKKDINDN